MSDIGTQGLITYIVFLTLFVLMSITFLISVAVLIIQYRKKRINLLLLNAFGIVKASFILILISFIVITLIEYLNLSTLSIIDDLSIFSGLFFLIIAIWYGIKYPKWMARK